MDKIKQIEKLLESLEEDSKTACKNEDFEYEKLCIFMAIGVQQALDILKTSQEKG